MRPNRALSERARRDGCARLKLGLIMAAGAVDRPWDWGFSLLCDLLLAVWLGGERKAGQRIRPVAFAAQAV
ncbi:MAG TPA: hypothetical protein VGB08_05675 [Allosphingosinicella sp.]